VPALLPGWCPGVCCSCGGGVPSAATTARQALRCTRERPQPHLTSTHVAGCCSARPGTSDSKIPQGCAPRATMARDAPSYTSAFTPCRVLSRVHRGACRGDGGNVSACCRWWCCCAQVQGHPPPTWVPTSNPRYSSGAIATSSCCGGGWCCTRLQGAQGCLLDHKQVPMCVVVGALNHTVNVPATLTSCQAARLNASPLHQSTQHSTHPHNTHTHKTMVLLAATAAHTLRRAGTPHCLPALLARQLSALAAAGEQQQQHTCNSSSSCGAAIAAASVAAAALVWLPPPTRADAAADAAPASKQQRFADWMASHGADMSAAALRPCQVCCLLLVERPPAWHVSALAHTHCCCCCCCCSAAAISHTTGWGWARPVCHARPEEPHDPQVSSARSLHTGARPFNPRLTHPHTGGSGAGWAPCCCAAQTTRRCQWRASRCSCA
jgi:hypothetical protein